ncbi:MAG: N-acetyltransferase [Bdellovibrionaceae bacterium]|nr:N-acetyltransferase [Pseudobdellovibrionaceae bacterium]
MSTQTKIRNAEEQDIPVILNFIRQLAEYEKLSHEVVVNEELIKKSLFLSDHKAAYCILAFSDNQPAGFALYFKNFSTFKGRPGIYLEDLFVDPKYRGKGIGKKLLQELARRALESNFARLEWSVLDWNTPAIQFYESIGAKKMEEWFTFRMTEEAMTQFIDQ